MALKIQTICCGQLSENAYLLLPDDRTDCAVIDPGDGLYEIQEAVKASGRRLTDILLTHAHFDHMLSAPHLKRFTGAALRMHTADVGMLADPDLNLFEQSWCSLPLLPVKPDIVYDCDETTTDNICGMNVTVMHTPGHTPGSVCYIFNDDNIVFSGDLLFARGYGRIDFPGGNGKDMVSSLRRIIKLPADMVLCSGHGPVSTIKDAVKGLKE